MKKLLTILLLTTSFAQAQTIREFRQWYLDKQITNAALLSEENGILASFSPGKSIQKNLFTNEYLTTYQYLLTGTFSKPDSKNRFGAYVLGQKETDNIIMLNYARRTPLRNNASFLIGVNAGLDTPLGAARRMGSYIRVGLGMAIQKKENYLGISYPILMKSVKKDIFTSIEPSSFIIQGGFSAAVDKNLKLKPSIFMQIGTNDSYYLIRAQKLFTALDVALSFKDFIQVNAALGVRGFEFGTTNLQRFGLSIKPSANIMFGYQREVLGNFTLYDYNYHSVWFKYMFQRVIK